jgi:hypothetical protein
MRRMSIVFVCAMSALIAGTGLAADGYAQTPMSDADYCQALVRAFDVNGPQRGRWETDLDVAVATAQCNQGNPGPAIPVLQKKLRDADIPVPTRT